MRRFSALTRTHSALSTSHTATRPWYSLMTFAEHPLRSTRSVSPTTTTRWLRSKGGAETPGGTPSSGAADSAADADEALGSGLIPSSRSPKASCMTGKSAALSVMTTRMANCKTAQP